MLASFAKSFHAFASQQAGGVTYSVLGEVSSSQKVPWRNFLLLLGEATSSIVLSDRGPSGRAPWLSAASKSQKEGPFSLASAQH